jgi:hypothetical protein
MRLNTGSTICILLLVLTVTHLSAQQWKLDQEHAPKVSVTGTSTLSDWEVTCPGVSDVPALLTFDPQKPEQITEFGFKVPVETMDGGRGASMNDKIKTAFVSTEHPYVQFSQSQPASITSSGNPGEYTINSTGTLSMAGVDKTINVQCTAVVKDDILVISGFKDMKFSEFNMTPPSAMFGQIKTNDDIVVSYQFRYLKQ